MRSYRILPHTADVRLKVEGESLPELFTAALEGMSELIKPGSSKHKGDDLKDFTEKHEVTASSPNVSLLLVDFLAQTLTLSHIHYAIFSRVQFLELGRDRLKARIYGRRESFEEDIKAVTYHEVEIKKNVRGFYETTLVFDI